MSKPEQTHNPFETTHNPFQQEEALIVVPSILDRLMEAAHGQGADVDYRTQTNAQLIERIQAQICRDIADLLNCRRRVRGWPQPLALLEDAGNVNSRSELALQDQTVLDRALYDLGLPDFGAFSLATDTQRQQLAGVVGEVLKRFEPRVTVKNVQYNPPQVNGQSVDQALSRHLFFSVDLVLTLGAETRRLVFSAAFDRPTRLFEVHVDD